MDPRVDLIVSDVEVPEMTGLELLRNVARISPKTAGLLRSGHSKIYGLPPSVPFLQKANIDELACTVERALAKTRKLTADIAASTKGTAELRGQAQQRYGGLLEVLRNQQKLIRSARSRFGNR
jgi:DNA-binding NtrC family response regulator